MGEMQGNGWMKILGVREPGKKASSKGQTGIDLPPGSAKNCT